MQRKFLEGLTRGAVAQYFALSLPVRGLYDVAVNRDGPGVVFVGQAVSQNEPRMERIAAACQTRNASSEDGTWVVWTLRVKASRWNLSVRESELRGWINQQSDERAEVAISFLFRRNVSISIESGS